MPRGVPQIEITYDVDADGILNVSACEKSSGKSETITVTNDKSRLSGDEINEMVNNAEKFKEEDTKARLLVEAKNELESYVFRVKASLNDPNIKEKLTSDEISTIQKNVEQSQDWMVNATSQNKEDYDNERQRLETVFAPIMTRVAQQQASETNIHGDEDEDEGPQIEEVD